MASGWYKIASAALGALIGSACGDSGDTGSGGTGATAGSGGTGGTGLTAEYGMPNAQFVVSGTVTADSSGDPLEGIEVTMSEASQSTSTDANGDFELSFTAYAFCNDDPCDADLTATDVDGPAGGGEFETTTVSFQLQQTEPGGGTWDEGTWEADNVDVSMADAAAGGGGAGGGTGGAGGAGGAGGG